MEAVYFASQPGYGRGVEGGGGIYSNWWASFPARVSINSMLKQQNEGGSSSQEKEDDGGDDTEQQNDNISQNMRTKTTTTTQTIVQSELGNTDKIQPYWCSQLRQPRALLRQN